MSQNSQETEIQDAVKGIPWNQLSAEARSKIKSVLNGYSVFRRMPEQVVASDPEMYQFLLQHPDIVVGFWEKLGATQISVREIRPNRYAIKEVTGTVAVAEVLYRTHDLCIVYARGQYKGPFLAKSYEGDTVLILRSRCARNESDESFVICNLDTFVRVENIGADFIVKLFSTSLGKIADSNFEQTVAFVGHVSEASGINGTSVKGMVRQMDRVRPEIREDFGDVVERVAMRAAKNEGRVFQYLALEAEIMDAYAAAGPTSWNDKDLSAVEDVEQDLSLPPGSLRSEFLKESCPADFAFQGEPSLDGPAPIEFFVSPSGLSPPPSTVKRLPVRDDTDPRTPVATTPSQFANSKQPDSKQEMQESRQPSPQVPSEQERKNRVIFGQPKIARDIEPSSP